MDSKEIAFILHWSDLPSEAMDDIVRSIEELERENERLLAVIERWKPVIEVVDKTLLDAIGEELDLSASTNALKS